MDRIDRQIVAHLIEDGRSTYQELGRQVRLSANTIADRVRRLQAAGVISGYRADLNLEAVGRGLQMISDVRLRDGVDRSSFEAQLQQVPQIIGAMRLTGEYEFQLRMACIDPPECEVVIDRLKDEFGVREVRSRLLLHEVPLGLHRILES